MTIRKPFASRLVVGALLAIALGAAGCGSDEASGGGDGGSQSSSAPPEGTLVNDGQFTVCMDTTFPPMEYFEEGSSEPRGFDVAAAKAVAERWGVEPVLKTTAFDGLLPAVQAGRCDVAWSSMYVTPERTKTFATVPYAVGESVALVEKGNPMKVGSPEDLDGKVIAAQTGTALLEMAKELVEKAKAEGRTPPRVQEYGTATDLVQQVVVGRAAAALTINSEAQFRVKQAPDQFEVGYAFGDEQPIGIFFSPDKRELGEALRKTLVELEEEGVLAEAAKEEGFPEDAIKIGAVQGP